MRSRRLWLLWLGVATSLANAGCVERKMIVRSDPPGAAVYVDGERKGVTTPDGLEVGFESYGTRTVVVRGEGYVPLVRQAELEVPWYQVFPLGLFSDLLWPGTIVDAHPVSVTLTRRGPPLAAGAVAKAAEHFAETQERRP